MFRSLLSPSTIVSKYWTWVIGLDNLSHLKATTQLQFFLMITQFFASSFALWLASSTSTIKNLIEAWLNELQ